MRVQINHILNNNKSRFCSLLSLALLLVCLVFYAFQTHTAFAVFNKEINYQGKLVDSAGATVADGTYHMRFNLYTTETGGVSIWSEDRSTAAGDRATVTGGLFSIMLGSSTPLTTVDFNQTLYLGVEIGGSAGAAVWDGEMTPRKKLGAVPAAFVADTLDNISSEQFLRNDAVNATSTASTWLTFTQNGAGKIAEFFGPSSNSALAILSGGNVGIGTTTPYAKLSVAGQVVGEYFTSTSTSAASTFPLASTTLLTVGTAGYFPGSGIWNSSGLSVGTTTQSAVFDVTKEWPSSLSTNLMTNFTSYGDSSRFVLRKANGTEALPTQVLTDEVIGNLNFRGYHSGGAFATGASASISAAAEEDLVSGGWGGRLAFNTTLNGTQLVAERMRITNAGFVGIGTTTPWAMLSINPDGISGPAFAVGSSTATHMVITNGGLTGIGTSAPTAQLTVIGNTNQAQFSVATSTTDTPLFYVTSTSTGALDYARVGVGISSLGSIGLRDQLTVAGRIYSTWRELSCEAFGANIVASTGNNTDVSSVCGEYSIDADTDGGILVQTTATPSFGRLRAGFTGGATNGEGVALRTWTRILRIGESPVFETKVAVSAAAASTLYMAGFVSNAPAADTATMPTDGLIFAASTTNTWIAIARRSNIESRVNTGVATSTSFQKLRIEATSTQAIYFIDDVQVASFTSAQIPAAATDMAPYISLSVIATVGAARRFDVQYVRTWIDDPPGGYESTPIAFAEESPEELPYDALKEANISTAYLTDDPSEFTDGDLVSMDTSGSAIKVKKANTPYDQTVMGVINNATSHILGEERADTVRVAMNGRAMVKANTKNGAIKIGDFITTSAISGEAQKATESGFVIGRALTALSSGTGEVVVDINLHFEESSASDIEGRIAALENVLVQDINADQETEAEVEVETEKEREREKKSLVASVFVAMQDFGMRIEKGVTFLKNLVVENLTVGSSEKPTGITLYDEKTGEPYCLKISSGRTVTKKGECSDASEDENENENTNQNNRVTETQTETDNDLETESESESEVIDVDTGTETVDQERATDSPEVGEERGPQDQDEVVKEESREQQQEPEQEQESDLTIDENVI
jgi:hypothetical protein